MNDNQIRCFLEVASEKNFTKAATHLFITQPAISKVILSLEKELGTRLFVRFPSKKIELTPAGQAYYEFFQKSKIEFENVREYVNSFAESEMQLLRLGYASGWDLSDFLPEVLSITESQSSHISFEVECLGFHELVENLQQRRLEIILTLEDQLKDVEGVEKEVVARLDRTIVYSDRYTELHGAVNEPCDLASAVFFLTEGERKPPYSDQIRNYCRPYGFMPQFQFLRNRESVIAKVESGLGVAFFDMWAQILRMKHFQYLRLGSQHEVSLAWQKMLPKSVMNRLIHNMKNELRRCAAEV